MLDQLKLNFVDSKFLCLKFKFGMTNNYDDMMYTKNACIWVKNYRIYIQYLNLKKNYKIEKVPFWCCVLIFEISLLMFVMSFGY